MFRSTLIRRAVGSLVVAGAAFAGVAATSRQAGAQVYPRIGLYWLTPTEYFNACPLGIGSGVTDYDGGSGNTANGMTLDCTKGYVTYTVS